MEYELLPYRKGVKIDDIREAIFEAIKYEIKYVSLPAGLCGGWEEYLNATGVKTKLASIISYPNGIQSTGSRVYNIVESARKGISAIDLVINTSLAQESNWKKFTEDIITCVNSCKSKDLPVRAVLEYRLFPANLTVELCHELSECGINTLITSSGAMVDDLKDVAITTYQIRKHVPGVQVIATGNFMDPIQQISLEKAGASGIRFTSVNSMKRILDKI